MINQLVKGIKEKDAPIVSRDIQLYHHRWYTSLFRITVHQEMENFPPSIRKILQCGLHPVQKLQ